MENFISLSTVSIVFFYMYLRSIKLNNYFLNAKGFAFNFISLFVFTFLQVVTILVFIDILTISSNKILLSLKELYALNILATFEFMIMILLPCLYIYYLNTEIADKNPISYSNKKTKYNSLFVLYCVSLLATNLTYLRFYPFFYPKNLNSGFAEIVPRSLASNSQIINLLDKIVYFNFSILMFIGKIIGFTYLPYGMAKYVHDLIYTKKEERLESNDHPIMESDHKENTPPEIKDDCEIYCHQVNSPTNNKVLKNSNSSSSSSDFFSGEGTHSSGNYSIDKGDKEKKIKDNSIDLEETHNKSLHNSDGSLITVKSENAVEEEEETFLHPKNYKEKKHWKITTIDEFLMNNHCLQDNNIFSYRDQEKLKLHLLKPISKSIYNFFLYSYIIFSIFLIFGILATKTLIVYVKLFYSICGADCGLLTYRYDDTWSLETPLWNLGKVSAFFNVYIKFDFIFLSFILLFRALTLHKAVQEKGISLLWKTFHKPERTLAKHQLIQLYATILFSGVVLLYDFNYLLPDYVRFYGLKETCDYTQISKPNCGVSFIGLLFAKLSMNYHFFMYCDILACTIFITTGVVWSVRLIIKPLCISLYHNLFGKQEWQIKNENLCAV